MKTLNKKELTKEINTKKVLKKVYLNRTQKKALISYKKKIVKLTKILLKALIKNILLALIGCISFISVITYLISIKINNILNKIPKRLKTSIIILIIVLSITIPQKPIKWTNKHITNYITYNISLKETEEEKQEEEKQPTEEEKQRTYICNIGTNECLIYDISKEYNLTYNEIKIAIAITKHETGNYTSPLFKNSNNIGGLYNSNTKSFYKFNTKEDGIHSFIKNLKNGYFNKGLTTIEKIQPKYAPLKASNDKNNLNANWVKGVTYFYNELD